MRWAAAAMTGAVVLAAGQAPARAGDGDDEIVVPRSVDGSATPPSSSTPPKQVIVVVQQQPSPTGRRAAPHIGDPPGDVEAYLRGLKDDAAASKEQYRDARHDGDDAAIDAAQERMRADDRFYASERERLTERNGGLIAGGATLIGIGGGALLTSAVMGFIYAFEDLLGTPSSTLGYAALGTLGGGFLMVGAGIPMLVIGVQRVPREVDSAYDPPPSLGFNPTAGLTFQTTF